VPVSATAYDWVCTVVRTDAAIVLEAGKQYLVESRLTPLAREAGERDVTAFIDRIRTSADRRARARVVDALTTNETSWFRDGGPFATFERGIVPELMARRATKSLRVWSAACSTGQEPYGLAMILSETAVRRGWSCQIHATDLSPTVLAQARQGVYNQLEIKRGLPAGRLAQHFTVEGTGWRASEALRRMITFQELNLARPFPALGQFDVVFLRNVLIYFTPAMRGEILRRVRAVCRPDGYLVLGNAETTVGLDDAWVRQSINGTTVFRPPTAA
jgi:chemotaxis protein methyltransferase CheR